MFEAALKAHIPMVAVTTDDLVNLSLVLSKWVYPRKVRPFPAQKNVVLMSDCVYHTDDLDFVTSENYRRITEAGTQLVVVNPDKPNSLMVAVGEVPTPDQFLLSYLKEDLQCTVVDIPGLMQALKGCSLKAASELTQLASATYGEITPKSIAAMRMKFSGATPGLYPLNTDTGYWEPQTDVVDWISMSRDYMKLDVKPALQPKGLLLHGLPGTGKSMAAKIISKEFGVPAFRLDMATTLNRYIGESESRVARNLDLLTKYAPCVVLLDEVEKVFNGTSEDGTTSRLLSQMLWWLQERRTPCPVIMTTNKLAAIPPELYRDGRLDQVVLVPPMLGASARHLGIKVFNEVVGPTTAKQAYAIRALFSDPEGQYIPAQVTRRVISMIKENKWA